MATTSILLGTTAGLEVVSGLFDMGAAEDTASSLRAEAALVRAETNAETDRYALSAARFKASQKLAYLKSGVKLEGSPLDILDETARVARENISAMKARGRAEASALTGKARQTQAAGRAAFIGGLTSAAGLYAKYGLKPGSSEAVAAAGPTTTTSSGSKTYNKSSRLNLTGF